MGRASASGLFSCKTTPFLSTTLRTRWVFIRNPSLPMQHSMFSICSAVTATLWPIAMRVMSILAHFATGLRMPDSSPGTSMPVGWPRP